MPNKTFLRATSLLCQPLSIAAMLVLLFNDHWLRWYAPSWWTGKLGDFAWLFFTPFAATMILALIVPPSPRQEKIVPALAFGLIGGIFALAKTVPLFHARIVQIVETILGLPIGLRRDPTDLIALVSLGAAWWLWQRHATTARAAVAPGLIALLLAATLTLANGPMPEYGVTGIIQSGDAVIARATYSAWRSPDGGLTWEAISSQELQPIISSGYGKPIITDTLNVNVQYRVTPRVSIERSDDGGKTWRTEFTMTPLSEAAFTYANRRQYGFFQGPLQGIVDPHTGNAIFAMAHEGALVRKPSGEYVWVAIGPHQHFVFNDPMGLLQGEMILALGLGLLILATLATRVIQHPAASIFAALAWFVWLADSVLFPPGRSNIGYGAITAYWFAIGVCIVVGILTAILVFIAAQRSLRAAAYGLIIGVISAPLYFAPFYLWALNLIPNYVAAMLFAFALGAVMVIVGWWATHGVIPSIKSASQKVNNVHP